MGMQGHYDMSSPTEGQFKEAAEAYSKALGAGGEIQLTELDLKSVKIMMELIITLNTKSKHIGIKLFMMLSCLWKKKESKFNAITFWGTMMELLAS